MIISRKWRNRMRLHKKKEYLINEEIIRAKKRVLHKMLHASTDIQDTCTWISMITSLLNYFSRKKGGAGVRSLFHHPFFRKSIKKFVHFSEIIHFFISFYCHFVSFSSDIKLSKWNTTLWMKFTCTVTFKFYLIVSNNYFTRYTYNFRINGMKIIIFVDWARLF